MSSEVGELQAWSPSTTLNYENADYADVDGRCLGGGGPAAGGL